MQIGLASLLNRNGKWLEQQQNSILSAATIITIANIISALSGLLRQRLLLSSFFHTAVSQQAYEAFLLAFQLPDTMFQLVIIGALSAAFIPIFTAHQKRDQNTAFEMSSIMMNVLLVVFIIVSIFIFVFAYPLTATRTGSGFTDAQREIATNLTRIMLFAQFFFAISNFMTGILQSFQRFIIPSIAPIFYNVGILVGVYFFSQYIGIYSAGVGVIIGAFMHMAIQLPLVMKLGFRYKFSFNLKKPGIKEFFKLMPPRMLAIGVSEARKLSLGFFATSLGNLSFVVMQLALTLMAIPIRFFGVPISQASLPFLSKQSEETDRVKFCDLVTQSMHQIAFFTLPMAVMLLILRVPIVRLIYGTNDFPWPKTVQVSWVVAIISLSITVQAMGQLILRAFYAIKNTRTPFLIATIDIGLYLVFCTYTIYYTSWGVMGLAAATTLTAFVEFGLYLLFLNREVGGFFTKNFWWPQFKMMTVSFLMAVFTYLPFKILDEVVFDTSRTIELIGLTITTSTIGMLVYIYFALLFDIKELDILVKLANRFGQWRPTLQKSDEVLLETNVEGDGV